MAVLIENISIITRKDSLDQKFPGGWRGLFESYDSVWHDIFYDDETVCISYRHAPYVKEFIEHLESNNLIFMQNGQATDIAIVDSIHGLLTPASWLEFSRIKDADKKIEIAACWIFKGNSKESEIHAFFENSNLCTPENWNYTGSFSEKDFEALQSKNLKIENEDWYKKERILRAKRLQDFLK